MIKFLFSIVFTLALSGLFGFAQPYDLRPKYTEGQLTTHAETSNMTILTDYFPGNEIKYQIKSEYTQLVKKIHADGKIDLVITFIASEMIGNDAPPQRMDYSHILGVPITVQLSANYRILKISASQELSNEARQDFQRFKQTYHSFSPDAYTPDHLVNLGDSWDKDNSYSFEMMGSVFDQLDKSKSVLKEEKTYQERSSLHIDFEGEFTGTISEGMTGSISGSYLGERTIEKQTGQDLHMKIAIDQTMDSSTEQGNVSFQIKIEIERQLTAETSVSVR